MPSLAKHIRLLMECKLPARFIRYIRAAAIDDNGLLLIIPACGGLVDENAGVVVPRERCRRGRVCTPRPRRGSRALKGPGGGRGGGSPRKPSTGARGRHDLRVMLYTQSGRIRVVALSRSDVHDLDEGFTGLFDAVD